MTKLNKFSECYTSLFSINMHEGKKKNEIFAWLRHTFWRRSKFQNSDRGCIISSTGSGGFSFANFSFGLIFLRGLLSRGSSTSNDNTVPSGNSPESTFRRRTFQNQLFLLKYSNFLAYFGGRKRNSLFQIY